MLPPVRFPQVPSRVKWTADEVPKAGSFSVGPFPNRACEFPRALLSSDHFGYGLVARPAWMSSWQRRQVIKVLRRRLAIRCIQAGLSRRPGFRRIGAAEAADVSAELEAVIQKQPTAPGS